MKKIGIIGGAGPMASCLLYELIIKKCQQNFGCKNDKDFPEITLISFPFSPMLALEDSKENKLKIASELQLCVNKLKKCKTDVVAIACNTLHSFVKNIDFMGMKILPITEEVIKYAKQKNIKKLLILATPTTLKNKIYGDKDIELVYPNEKDQTLINKIIDKILTGNINQNSSIDMSKIIKNSYDKQPFDGTLLGCTDLPILNQKHPFKLNGLEVKLLDSLEILASSLVKKSFNNL